MTAPAGVSSPVLARRWGTEVCSWPVHTRPVAYARGVCDVTGHAEGRDRPGAGQEYLWDIVRVRKLSQRQRRLPETARINDIRLSIVQTTEMI